MSRNRGSAVNMVMDPSADVGCIYLLFSTAYLHEHPHICRPERDILTLVASKIRFWKWTEALYHRFINTLSSVELDHIQYCLMFQFVSGSESTCLAFIPPQTNCVFEYHNNFTFKMKNCHSLVSRLSHFTSRMNSNAIHGIKSVLPYQSLVSSLSKASSFLRKISLMTPSLLLLLLLLLLLPTISPLAKRIECSAETTDESRLGCCNITVRRRLFFKPMELYLTN